jgi:hypothetical protein
MSNKQGSQPGHGEDRHQRKTKPNAEAKYFYKNKNAYTPCTFGRGSKPPRRAEQ